MYNILAGKFTMSCCMHREKHLYFKMLITFEPNVAFTAFTMYRRLKRRLFWRLFLAPHSFTLNTFGFLVGGRLAARRAVSRHWLPKAALFGPKNNVFWPEINLLCTSSNFFITIMTDTKKDNIFSLLMLLSKLQVGCKSPFLAKRIWFLCFPLYCMAS